MIERATAVGANRTSARNGCYVRFPPIPAAAERSLQLTIFPSRKAPAR
jgi:hypothetical protein